MTGAVFSYALLAALATALLFAAFTDLRARHIDNWLNLGIAIAAPLWWLAMGLGPFAIGVQIGLAALTFAVACVLFAIGQMGGGDVKLLAALALWFAPAAFLQLIVLMAVLGGGASLAMAAFNMTPGRKEGARDIVAGIVALAWVCCAGAIVLAIATDRPVVPPGTLQALADVLPGLWAIPLAGAVVLGLFLFGMRHIMRRQKSRIEVPYGIAIAAAALWVMGSQSLVAVQPSGQSAGQPAAVAG
ncbi:prepilin peptidase [Novosphingobium guangzhouense]|uniref:Potassium:proton antiporter n=1 Tax=Novosphingobium guangzhouense TaxID=1850347 RepID=A0A2K2FVW7_9SPHN|nr:prepilin peptidase [Novosphingobium guangzhouense]PNU02937.1 potassium:proton antiporter [Novosphingobium guangzhouense]